MPMPFDHKQYNSTKQLTIGYYDDDEYFTPVPACRRAVQEAAEAFKAAGHIVKRFDPVLVREAVMCFYGIMSADGHMAGFYNGLQGEKLLYIYESLATMAFMYVVDKLFLLVPIVIQRCIYILIALLIYVLFWLLY